MTPSATKRPLAVVIASVAGAMLVAAMPAQANNTASNSGATHTSTTASTNATDRATHVRQVRASKLIGKDVRNAQGHDLGDIKDLVIDANNGKVHYVVLSFGGFLGLGDKLFAFPTRAFKPAQDKDELILTVDKQKLEKAPGFEPSAYPDWNSPNYRNQVDRYFGSDMAMPSSPNMRLVRATDLIGQDVSGPSGKHLGDIQDLVLNMSNGDVRYAVLEFDKSWSLGDKLFAFPMTAFNRDAQGDLTLGISKQALSKVPGFDKDHWPNVNDPKWVADVDRYLIASVAVPLPSTTNDALFQRLDSNGDGTLSKQEVKSDTALTSNWQAMDGNGDGRVTRSEFDSKYRQ